MSTRWFALGAALCMAAPVLAQDTPVVTPRPQPAPAPTAEPKPETKPEVKTLVAGDKAPALSISEWVKGEPVTGFERGKTYVVEFWATWCPPCRKSIPHLTELQHKHKAQGLTIIGISGEDRNGESLEKVKEFVEKTGAKMEYTVAFDKARETRDAWMKAAKQNGIPTAFVVDGQGTIAWIGNPLNPQFDEVLDKVVAGKWTEEARRELARRDEEMREANRKIGEAMQAEDYDAALKAMDEAIAKNPKSAGQFAMTKFHVHAKMRNDEAAAARVADEAAKGVLKDDAQALNAMAWTMLDEFESPDLDVALRVATQADNAAGHKDGMILDTLALAHFKKGNVDKAIQLQEEALKLSADLDESMREEMEGRLREFKASKSGKTGPADKDKK
ncbi:MAG TPA: redoxin domain-containing protein [Phycisphaerales bacterium]|nr:redoxin domain-containing protein [Phycisphaerales bacterium]